jgi:predicted DNA-binding transcriptional regulator AlpA
MSASDRDGSTSAKFALPLPFLRTPEAARFLGLSARTLEKRRIYGTGPKFSKVGGRILYAVSDLREWVELGAKRSTSDPGKVTIPALPRRARRRGDAKAVGELAAKLDEGAQ